MNLLVLSPWFPAPPDNGSRLRAFHLLRCWRDAGHGIHLLTGLQDDIADTAALSALEALCESVQVFDWHWHDGGRGSPLKTLLSNVPRSVAETRNPALTAAMEAGLARKPDACVAMQLAAAPFVPRTTHGVPVLLEEVEITGVARAVDTAPDAKAKLLASLTKAKHDVYWKRELCRFDALTVVSQEEANAVRYLLGANAPPVSVVPNGVDCAAYPPRDTSPIPGRLLYNGSLTYPPNAVAVAWFVQEILPTIAATVPGAHLAVTGKYPADEAARYANNPRVMLTGFVPDMRPELAQAAVCAVPLRSGGGTRLKILEAWAAGVPVVSTPIGAVGLAGSADGEHLLVADDAESFAAACVQLLTDAALAARLAQNAHVLAAEHYDWAMLAAQILEVLNTVRSTQKDGENRDRQRLVGG